MLRSLLTATALIMALAGIARAEDICSVPKAQWQPEDALKARLEAEGWKISRLKIDEGCYEVYGHDAAGHKVEAYFDPKTLARVDGVGETEES